MTMLQRSAGTHLRLPPQRFYWGLLDTSLLRPHHRRDWSRLAFLLEPLLPLPLGDVHFAIVRIDAARALACAIERSTLESQCSAETVTLGPSEAPEHLGQYQERVRSINLLTGKHTPPPVARLRRSVALRAAIACPLVSIVLLAGLERRARHCYAQTVQVHARIDQVYESIFGATLSGVDGAGQPRELALLAERRRLEQTRREVNLPDGHAEDICADLEELVRRWPSEHHLTTETISLTPAAITIRASLPMAEVQDALESFVAWNNWRRHQPEVTNQRGVTAITVRYTRSGEGGGS